MQPAGILRPNQPRYPVIHYMDQLIYRPLKDGWLSWPCWLTNIGRLNHKVVTHSASSLAHDRESSPAENSVQTTMLLRQLSKLSKFTFTFTFALCTMLCRQSQCRIKFVDWADARRHGNDHDAGCTDAEPGCWRHRSRAPSSQWRHGQRWVVQR